MAFLVHVLPECQQDAKTQGVWDSVFRFAEKLQGEGHCGELDRYLPTPFLKKRLAKNRIIALAQQLDGHQVVLLVRMYVRGDSAYERFINDIQDPTACKRQVAKIWTPDLVAELRSELAALVHEDTPAKEEPSDWELEWLSGMQHQVGDDITVLESVEWVRAMLTDEHQRLASAYHGVVEELLANVTRTEALLTETRSWSDRLRVGVLYRWFPTANYLLLVKPCARHEDLNSTDSQGAVAAIGALPDDRGLSSEVLRHCARAYPGYVVVDRDAWMDLERDEESNLALSPEEERVLSSIQNTDSERMFPLFVNGRAGSGKSTMLQYIAADYARKTLRASGRLPELFPLYIACSASLLSAAKERLRRMLRYSYQSIIEKDGRSGGGGAGDSVEHVVTLACRVFHEHLQTILPTALRNDAFARDRRIGFSDFQSRWPKKFGMQRELKAVSPELAWHVIRTYIKGMTLPGDEAFDEAAYVDLPRRQKSVTQETFALVLNRVWRDWYFPMCEKEGVWDDQDLAREVLASAVELPQYPAVFCDEAQDLTRLEIELLFRMSLFSRRVLHPFQLKTVPLVLVGDPLQTLNPTGFQWRAVGAAFTERIVVGLDPFGQSDLAINYHELQTNYRSSEFIVRFTNAILLLRALAFPMEGARKEDRPEFQKWWRASEGGALPMFFDVRDASVRRALKELGNLNILVACDAGQEAEFVREDPLLSEIVERDELGTPRNVASAASAKGLEFDNVVLYRFGARAPAELLEVLSSKAPREYDPDRHIPSEYFLNKLYVAASRARKRLFIVDQAEVLQGFWMFGRESVSLEALVRQSPQHGSALETWESKVCFMGAGSEQSWTSEGDDPIGVAGQWRKKGEAERDPGALRRAALWYARVGERASERECLARAYELERDFRRAGQMWLELRNPENAVAVWWRGKAYGELAGAGALLGEFAAGASVRCAMFMSRNEKERRLDAAVTALTDVAESVWPDDGLSTWREVLDAVIAVIGKAEAEAYSPAEWERVAAVLDAIIKRGLSADTSTRARLAFWSGDVEGAVRLWSGMDEGKRPRQYWSALASISPLPGKVAALSRIEEYAEIVSAWEGAGSPRGSEIRGVLDIVWRAGLRCSKYDQAASIVVEVGGMDEIRECARKLVSTEDRAVEHLVPSLVRDAVVAGMQEQRWDDVARILGPRGILTFVGASAKGGSVRVPTPEIQAQCERAILEECAKGSVPDRGAARNENLLECIDRVAFFGRDWPKFHKLYSLGQAGVVLERFGRGDLSQSYYEWLKENGRPQERLEAAKRLWRVIDRRLKTLEARKEALSEGEKRERGRLDGYRRDLRNILGAGTVEQIPEYPDASVSLVEISAPEVGLARKRSCIVRGCRVRVSGEGSKVLVENEDLDAFGVLDVGAWTMSGDGAWVEEVVEGARLHRSQAWGLTLRRGTGDASHKLIIASGEEGEDQLDLV